MELKVAIATDDKKKFTNSHFGDAKYFLIYNWTEDGELKFLEERENIKFDEETHGDKKKAKHMSNQLEGIPVLLAKVFGPNIVTMRKKFVPVVSRVEDIKEAVKLLELKKEIIEESLKIDGDKNIIYLDNKE